MISHLKSSTYLADGGVAGGHEEGDGVLQQVVPLPPLAQVAEEVELRLLNLVRQDLGGVRDVLLQRLVVAVPPFEVNNVSYHCTGFFIPSVNSLQRDHPSGTPATV